MRPRDYIGLYAISVIILFGIATQESVPGYMDADYYYANGLRIANTGSWSEPFLWNYLDNPGGIPHPAFTYWMPLAGIISAVAIRLMGLNNFWAAKLGFLFIAGFISPLTAYLAFTITPRRWAALLAGALAIFSGFYLVYLPTTDTFGIYMILGGIFFLLVQKLQIDSREAVPKVIPKSNRLNRFGSGFPASPLWIYLLMGVNIGLMYLTRADGIIWFGMALIAILLLGFNRFRRGERRVDNKESLPYLWFPLILVLAGFLVIISPWVLRNILIFGSIFAPGSGRAIWLTAYDELYSFPPSILTFERWLNSGIAAILTARGWAAGLNILTAFAVQGSIFLTPLIVAGMWTKRKDWRVSIALLGWLVTFLVMTLIFPFQGARGGFFHSGAGFQPLFWAVVPVGLLAFINWVSKFRNWEVARSRKLFAGGIIGLAIIMTIFVTWRRLADEDASGPSWGKSEIAYQEVEEFLNDLDVPSGDIVMVNNPPGYYAMTGRSAIAIPDGDLNPSHLVALKYQASYLILDENYPQGLSEIYHNPRDVPGLNYLRTIREMHIFSIEQ